MLQRTLGEKEEGEEGEDGRTGRKKKEEVKISEEERVGTISFHCRNKLILWTAFLPTLCSGYHFSEVVFHS